MSYDFDLNGRTIWDAGFRGGRLYLELAQGASGLLETPCGLAPNARGGCDIELPQFKAFTESLYEIYVGTHNAVLHGLVRGLLVTSLVLLERAGSGLVLKPEHEESFRLEKVAFRRAMG